MNIVTQEPTNVANHDQTEPLYAGESLSAAYKLIDEINEGA